MTIKDYLSDDELLCQLAEECSELSQAALKLRRAITSKNPTPKTYDECRENLVEEVADVCFLMQMMLFIDEWYRVSNWIDFKSERWLKRLEDANV